MKLIRSLSTALVLVVVLAAGVVLGRMSSPNHIESTLAQSSIFPHDVEQIQIASALRSPVAIEGTNGTAYDFRYTMPGENNSEGKTVSLFMGVSR
jgi:hypothetical protein